MLLAAGLHLPPEKDEAVKKIVNEVALTNRDPHLLFNQVGQRAGLSRVPLFRQRLLVCGLRATFKP